MFTSKSHVRYFLLIFTEIYIFMTCPGIENLYNGKIQERKRENYKIFMQKVEYSPRLSIIAQMEI